MDDLQQRLVPQKEKGKRRPVPGESSALHKLGANLFQRGFVEEYRNLTNHGITCELLTNLQERVQTCNLEKREEIMRNRKKGLEILHDAKIVRQYRSRFLFPCKCPRGAAAAASASQGRVPAQPSRRSQRHHPKRKEDGPEEEDQESQQEDQESQQEDEEDEEVKGKQEERVPAQPSRRSQRHHPKRKEDGPEEEEEEESQQEERVPAQPSRRSQRHHPKRKAGGPAEASSVKRAKGGQQQEDEKEEEESQQEES
jgi:hypothetical protein